MGYFESAIEFPGLDIEQFYAARKIAVATMKVGR
jgi:hypothetical protein